MTDSRTATERSAGVEAGGRSPVPPPPDGKETEIDKKVAGGDLLVSLGVIALGVFFFVGAFNIHVSPSYAHIGPRFFPLFVAAGLVGCGALLLLQALRGRASNPSEGEDVDEKARTNWGAIGVIAVTLFVDVLLIERAGFVIASTVLFLGIAFGFGSRRYARDALIGLALSAAVYVAFTRLLHLHLPGGLLTSVLGSASGGLL